MSALHNKYRLLQDLLRSYGKVAIAYSGGVDSSLLSYVAHETLGDNAISLTADAPVVPRSEFADSQAFCKRYSIRQVICHPNPIMMEEVRFQRAEPLLCMQESDIRQFARGSRKTGR